ncbi:hypothetical protein AVEN_78449-1 [Araneus ventricosus]|uniref:Chorion peroxidase n=1 Tax=Araneus ventricosus TaxID=182803 RepID=A0A4Y2P7W9_ARAVE|nr:hypothetical protein AVEN_78449-1 [Araneus ventricosus]
MNVQNWIFLFVIVISYIAVVAGSGQCDRSFKGKQSVEVDSDSDSDSDASESSIEDCSNKIYEIVQPSKFNDQIAEDPTACQDDKMLQCDPDSLFRTINGSCNNLKHPTWGMSTDCFLRFQPAFYTGYDGFRESTAGGPLPEPRDLTQKIFKNDERPSRNLTFMFTIYGQMVAHDLSRIQFLPVAHREQKNMVTGMLDSSTVYGPTEEKAATMRKYDGTGWRNTSFRREIFMA